jgi:hypothetical protein
MPEPTEYQILLALQSRFQAIALAGGYYHDVNDAAVKLDPNHDAEALKAPTGPRPFILIQVLPDRWQYFPANQERLVMPLAIHWVHEADETSDTERLKTFYRGCADIEKAMAPAANGTIWHGGLATSAKVTKRTLDPEFEGSQVWAMVDVEIVLHRTFGTP